MKELPATLLSARSASTRSRPTSGGRAGRRTRAPRSRLCLDRGLGAGPLPRLLRAAVRVGRLRLESPMAQPHGHSRRRVPGDDLLPRLPDRRVPPSTGRPRSPRASPRCSASRARPREMLKRLEADGLVERGEQKEAILTAEGAERAERVVRKHRLIERFLTDFMGYTAAESHVHADELGDTFTDDMIERINVRLDRPTAARTAGRWTPSSSSGRTRSSFRSRSSPPVARPRSSGWPSTTAISCTGSTTKGSCRGRRVGPQGAARRGTAHDLVDGAGAADHGEGGGRDLRPRRPRPVSYGKLRALAPRSPVVRRCPRGRGDEETEGSHETRIELLPR